MDLNFCLLEKDILYPHGGFIRYGNSNFDNVFRFSKVIRQRAF